MNTQPSNHEDPLAAKLSRSFKAHARATQDLLAEGVDRVAVLREMLRGRDRLAALPLLPHLRESELTNLFDDLVFLSSFSHGAIQNVRRAILSLPRPWVIGQIEKIAEPLIRDGTDDEFRRLLELYFQLDPDLTRRLAQRAASHPDEHVREAGEDFLAKLEAAENR